MLSMSEDRTNGAFQAKGLLGALVAALGSLLVAWSGSALAQQPSVTVIDAPEEVLIGEEFTFEVRFKNQSGAIGYGPYIDLVYDFGGADDHSLDPGTGQSGPCDGIEFLSASVIEVNGGPLSISDLPVVPSDCNGTTSVNHPWGTGFGPVSVSAGHVLVVLPLPYGSYGPNQPEIVVEVTARVRAYADAQVPLNIRARGGFRYGNQPNGTVPSVQSSWQSATVIPNVLTLEKKYNGLEDEGATGPTFAGKPLSYTLTLDVAEGVEVTGTGLVDNLPPGMSAVGVPKVTLQGTPLTEGPCAGGAGFDFQAPFKVLLCNSVSKPITGIKGPDVIVEFSFWVNDVTGVDCVTKTLLNDIEAVSRWVPLDPRDQPSGGYEELESDLKQNDHEFQAKCFPIQKKVSSPTAKPGDVLTYTLDFQVSDYRTIGDIVVEDVLGDGQRYVTGSATLTVVDDETVAPPVGLPFGAATLTAAQDPNAECSVTEKDTNITYRVVGGTRLTFDVSGLMAGLSTQRQSQGILTGALAWSPTTQTSATGRITFQAEVQEEFDFQHPPTHERRFVDKHDFMVNCVEIRGRVYQNESTGTVPTTPLGPTAKDNSGSLSRVPFGMLTKSVFRLNRPGAGEICGGNSPACTAPVEVRPMDEITFRLSMPIPTSDAEKVELQDWLPLPILNLKNDPWAPTLWQIPTPPCNPPGWPDPGETCQLSSPPVVGNYPTQAPPASDNSLMYDFGTFQDPLSQSSAVDLLFTVTANTVPFADELFLTNQVQECEGFSIDTVTLIPPCDTGTCPIPKPITEFCQVAVAQVEMREPVLGVKKGVIATDNPVSTLPDLPQGVTLASNACMEVDPGSEITSGSVFDHDLPDADANDTVTFSIVIENSGGAPAYNIVLMDKMPFDAGQFSCYEPGKPCVRDGAGRPYNVSWQDQGNGLWEFRIDSLPGTYAPAGHNILVITYKARLRSDLRPGCCENTARITRFTSGKDPSSPNFVEAIDGDYEDTARVCVGPQAGKCVVTTSEGHTINTPASAWSASVTEELAIGEIVRLRLVSVVPEGNMANFQMTDILPPGLSYLGNPAVAFVANKTIANDANWPTLKPPPELTCSLPLKLTPLKNTAKPKVSAQSGTGGDVKFPMVNVMNPPPNTLDLEFAVVEFNALVDNLPSNADGKVLPDTAQVCTDDSSGSGKVCDKSDPVEVKVVEPHLDVTKEVEGTVEVGDSVEFTITLTNTGNATAFDVRVLDELPECYGRRRVFSAPQGAIVSSQGQSPEIVVDAIEVGETVTIGIRAQIRCVECDLLVNRALVTYTSLPGEKGTVSNPTGSSTPGASGQPNGERIYEAIAEADPCGPAKVCGTKFLDWLEPYGVQQLPYEPGLGGWVITLSDPVSGKGVSALTDADGNFCIENIEPGPYQIFEKAKPGYGPHTLPLLDLTIPPGGSLDVMFANDSLYPGVRNNQLCAFKYEDLDGDGEYDYPDEPGLEGWTMELWQGNTKLAEGKTSATGYYCFEKSSLSNVTYTVREEDRFAWKRISPASGTINVTFPVGPTVEFAMFGNQRDPWIEVFEPSNPAMLQGLDDPVNVALNEARHVLQASDIGRAIEDWYSRLKNNDWARRTLGDERGRDLAIRSVAVGRSLVQEGGRLQAEHVRLVEEGFRYLDRIAPAPRGLVDTVLRRLGGAVGQGWDGVIRALATPAGARPGDEIRQEPVRPVEPVRPRPAPPRDERTPRQGEPSREAPRAPERGEAPLRQPSPAMDPAAGRDSMPSPERRPVRPPARPSREESARICGIVFEDANGDGRRNRDEVGLPNWRIGLAVGRNVSYAESGREGEFCFEVSGGGTYTVSVYPQDGWVTSTPQSREVSVPPSVTDLQFGLRKEDRNPEPRRRG